MTRPSDPWPAPAPILAPVRRDMLATLTRARWSWSDVRAGYVDARRTPGARALAGRRYGAADYAIGYAAGVILR